MQEFLVTEMLGWSSKLEKSVFAVSAYIISILCLTWVPSLTLQAGFTDYHGQKKLFSLSTSLLKYCI